MITAFLALTLIPYWLLYANVCTHCNRIGNNLDVWYRRAMAAELATLCESEGNASCAKEWRAVERGLNDRIQGTGFGVELRRALRFDKTPSILAV